MATVSRRQFLVSLLGAGVSALGYGTLVEPRWLEINLRTVPLSPLKNRRLRLLHLSDLHASAVVSFAYIERAIATGLLHRPDVICITGDFITDQIPDGRRYSRILRQLSDFAPTFACLGNHDGGKWARRRGGYKTTTAVVQMLADGGIRCLINETAVLSAAGVRMQVTGLGDWWAGQMQPKLAFERGHPRPAAGNRTASRTIRPVQNSDEVPLVRIVLSHNPDTKKFIAEQAWDLLLSGHTHGGQIRFPLLGAPFAPVRDRRFIEGLHQWRGRWLHITRGVGNVRGMRINCRPEVSILDLEDPDRVG